MNVDIRKALAEARDKRALQKLLCNKANLEVKHVGGIYYHKNARGKWDSQTGLLPPLRDTFWYDFDIKKAMKSARKAGVRKTRSHGKGRHYGSIRGTETHEQLQDMVELDQAAFRRRHPVIHEYTRQIMHFIMRQRWRPLAAEFHLCDPALRIATSIDMILLSEQDKLVFLEFKTGYAGYFKAASGMMHGALSELDNSHYSQAHVQLMSSVMLLAKSHGLQSSELEMYVVLVNDEMLSPHKINNGFLQRHATNIYRDLQALHTRSLPAGKQRRAR